MDTNKSKTQSSLNISEEVVSIIAQNVIKEIDGVHSLSILPSKYSVLTTPSVAKSVKINLASDTAQIDIAIVVDMNHKIKDVCEQVQVTVKDQVQNMTGIAVSKVNVYVTGVHVVNEQ
ncbi:Asp23/Gls24 family envelope stress response protein [Paludicola sp. MB14-C6]|uniref:Asp23/Gls24 family envelope stress response protein n=1 Tax=Paludihabitans sp. MB14-C6 TaxID=3070656 RepID=UPI0027DE297B|nr:Asp23/Gls24 family envelope stress response protein [Paludicola sp. MB14-C6]WMJ23028.1 Asp23/Gls24 family envelope stress response protein [Paludicola sp. MB14-C6]